jgi:hypothetical protein
VIGAEGLQGWVVSSLADRGREGRTGWSVTTMPVAVTHEVPWLAGVSVINQLIQNKICQLYVLCPERACVMATSLQLQGREMDVKALIFQNS